MKLARRTSTDSEIPTSSTADIAFLLIIFFMVTCVFSATRGLDLKLPRDDDRSDEPEPQDAVLIHVQPDRILVDCQPMRVDEILPYLEPRLTRNPDKPVILYTASDAQYRNMIEVYDTLGQTKSESSPWSFVVKNVFVPTRGEIADYVDTFGVNPLETRCDE